MDKQVVAGPKPDDGSREGVSLEKVGCKRSDLRDAKYSLFQLTKGYVLHFRPACLLFSEGFCGVFTAHNVKPDKRSEYIQR